MLARARCLSRGLLNATPRCLSAGLPEIPRLPDGRPDPQAPFKLAIPESLAVKGADGVIQNVRFESYRARNEILDLPTHVEVTAQELIDTFRTMSLIRRMETQTQSEYQMKKIRGFCHLYIGQEACITGIEAAVNHEDSIITSYRDHATYLMRGGTVFGCLAEMYGKDAGASRGKGGSMHYWNPEQGFYGGHGIVGAQIPLGAGLAFKHWYQNPAAPKNVSVVCYGDGAANQGQVFEAFNMAALWKLPAIFVIENNHFGMGTAEGRAAANTEFYKRAEYISGIKVDGMDYLAVKGAMQFAKNWCTSGNGPILVELDCYRYVGHSMSDPGTAYRTKDDVAVVRNKRDCIAKVKSLIYDLGLLDQAAVKEIEGDVTKQHVYVADELPIRACDASNLVYNKAAAPQYV